MPSRKHEKPTDPASGGSAGNGKLPAPSSVPEADRERCVQFYVDQLHKYVRRAATCVDDADRDDEFLWHIRRGLECIFAAVLEASGIAATEGSGALLMLETLRIETNKIARVEMLSDANYQSLAELLQKNANRGVHAESFQHGSSSARASNPSGRTSSAGVTVAKTPFVVLVRWLHGYLERSTASIEADLVAIEHGHRTSPTPPPTAVSRIAAISLIAFALGIVVAVVGLLLLQRHTRTARSDARLPSIPQARIVAGTRDASPPPDAGLMHSIPAPMALADARSRPNCPADMLLIAADLLRVNKPGWRSGSPWSYFTDGEIRAHRACLARALVTRREYDDCVAAGRCASLESRIAQNVTCRESPTESPVRCVSRDEAGRFCAWRHPAANGFQEGRVSSVVDWESLRRASPREAATVARIVDDVPADSEKRQGEWVGDPVPPALWSRVNGGSYVTPQTWHLWRLGGLLDTRAPAAWHSWNARSTTTPPFERIGFRCAIDLAD